MQGVVKWFRGLRVIRKVEIDIALAIAAMGVIVTFATGFPGAVSACRSLGWGWCGLSSPETSRPSASAMPAEEGASNGGDAGDATEAPAPEPSGAAEPTAGCYRDGAEVACTLRHTREVYPPAEGASCDTDSLVAYLGGVPGVDLLNADLAVEPLNGSASLCAITSATGSDLPTVSLKGLWTTDADRNGYRDGGQLRRCLSRQGQAVSCDANHSAEIFYAGTVDVSCDEMYRSFARRDAGTDARDIKVTHRASGDSVICQVEVKAGEDSLFASVRDLGRTALPITH